MERLSHPVEGDRARQGVAEFLERMRRRGMHLWSDNGQLRYRAPKGVIGPAEIERLRAARTEIVEMLENPQNAAVGELHFMASKEGPFKPLAFSQLAHWHRLKRGEWRSSPQISRVLRLDGSLNVEAFQHALDVVVHHHQALCTNFAIVDGELTQQIGGKGNYSLSMDDLSSVDADRIDVEKKRLVDSTLYSTGPDPTGVVLNVRLIKLTETAHVLVVAMDHMISDALSMDIFLSHVSETYHRISERRVISLPRIPTQFPEYAVSQHARIESQVKAHAAFWQSEFLQQPRCRFPEENLSLVESDDRSWASVPVHIEKDVKQRLQIFSRARRITLTLSVLTAYVATLLRWCNVADTVVLYQTSGRDSAAVEHTVGYFAAPVYLRVKLPENASFAALIDIVKEAYCDAYEHADYSYLATRQPPPDVTKSSLFNWVPHTIRQELTGVVDSPFSITSHVIATDDSDLREFQGDGEPGILLFDSEEGVRGRVQFPSRRFSARTMDRFARNFKMSVESMLVDVDAQVNKISFTDQDF